MNISKGMILAGVAGPRLWLATVPVINRLLPVYDKTTAYYLSTILILVSIKEYLKN